MSVIGSLINLTLSTQRANAHTTQHNTHVAHLNFVHIGNWSCAIVIVDFELDQRFLFAGVGDGSPAMVLPSVVLKTGCVVPKEVIITFLVVALPIALVVEEFVMTTDLGAFVHLEVRSFTCWLKTEGIVASVHVRVIIVKEADSGYRRRKFVKRL